jgi:glycosyltransferase involved in cell wall biosynthesis
MPVSVDIVLPCYNPNDTWYLELIKFYEPVKDKYLIKFIIVNDGSSGNMVHRQMELLVQKNIPVEFISYQNNKGKGYALRKGVEISGSSYVLYTDIDFPFVNQSMLAVIGQLMDGSCDIAAGNRDEKYYKKNMSGFRKILSKAFRSFITGFLKMPVTDTQCGLKGFNAKGKEIFLATKIDRYLFDFEFIYLSSRNKNIRIKPVEVELKDNVVFSKMKLKIIMQEAFNLFYILTSRKN